MREHPVLELVLIGVVAALVGVGIGLVIDWFPVQGSAEADDIDTLYDVLLAASIPIFVLVMTVAIYSVVRFRARPGETHDGPPIHGDTKLEVAWVTIPFMLVTALAIYGWIVLTDIEEPQPDSLVVDVRGEQFAWSFAYPDEGGETVQTADLMLPVDRQVEFRVQTEDVIHSFWVPAFRLKTDTVPGITTRIRATPSEEGTYDVVCAELCGLGHSTMRQSVTVVPEDEFDTWLADQQEALAAAEGGAGQAPSEGQSPSGVAAQEPPEEEPAPEGGGGAGGESRSGGASGGGESGSGGASADGGGSGGEGSSGG